MEYKKGRYTITQQKRGEMEMKKMRKILTIMVCGVMFAAVFAVAVPENALAATITVPDDYPTIQQAIDAASPGEIVYVRAGRYYEHVTIDKSLTLQGEDRENTIIDGDGSGNVIYINVNYVTINGLTATNGDYNTGFGICLSGISGVIIKNCKVQNSHMGINIGGSADNTVINNILTENTWDGINIHDSRSTEVRDNAITLNINNGIFIGNESNDITIANNDVSGNGGNGMHIISSNDNVITDNTVNENKDGIRLHNSSNNTITNNTANSNNVQGIWLGESNNNTIMYNIATNNSDNGIALHYSSNHNTVTDNTASNSYTGIALSESNNNTVTDNIASNNSENGISLQDNSYNNTITNNTAKSNDCFGINVGNSNNNKIIGNNVLYNKNFGIYLYSSNYNTLTDNTASNSDNGILLCSSSNHNTITDNTTSNNMVGISFESSNNNRIINSTANSNKQIFDGGGIRFHNSHNNTITNSTVNSNKGDGIVLSHSKNNTIINNTIKENNDCDLWISPETDEHCNNVIEDNIGSGNRPIKYLNSPTDLSDKVFSQLILCNADNSNINNVTIIGSETKRNNALMVYRTENSNFTNINSSNNLVGIWFESSSDNRIINSTVNSNELYGIYVIRHSNNNNIMNNNASNNSYGIPLYINSNNNALTNNIASNNSKDGIYLGGSSNNNVITGNTASFNNYGIYTSSSSNNLIYHNDIIFNETQALDYGHDPRNRWDNGYPSGGNYWSDYTRVDNYSGVDQDEPGSDGIGDTPYVFENNQDNYPLMRPCNILQIIVDIKPQSCPNPLNIKSQGVLPVAILGSEDFDVSNIDPSTILFEGVLPILNNIEDVATPIEKEIPCDCTDEGSDGYDDLTLKFTTQDIVAALGDVEDGDVVVLTLTGILTDNTFIEGNDCVVIHAKGKGEAITSENKITSIPTEYKLKNNYPNPFRSSTTVQYDLPERTQITITIYDLMGRKVKTLANNTQDAGYKSVNWDAKDDFGRNVSSGIYLIHMQAGQFRQTRKMVLSK